MKLKDKTIVFASKKAAELAYQDLEELSYLRMFLKLPQQIHDLDDATLAAHTRNAVDKLSEKLLCFSADRRRLYKKEERNGV